MTEDLKDWVVSRVDAAEVWRDYFPKWRPGHPVICPFHDDEKPSLSLSEDGKGLCHACSWKCTSVIGFIKDKYDIPFKRALKRVRIKYVGDTVPSEEWGSWNRTLLGDSDILQKLEETRGITKKTVKTLRLGWHKNRITIPIFDEMGCCVNVRMHDALRACAEGSPKMVSYVQGKGSARLYPLASLDAKHRKVYLFEGELNTILALQMGLNAVCVTGGARTWKDEWADRFEGRRVVVVHDVNDPDGAGQEGAKKKCESIALKAEWVKNVLLPIEDRGGDFIDFVVKHKGTADQLMQVESKTVKWGGDTKAEAEPEGRNYGDAAGVSLKEAALPENVGKAVTVRCLVSSMDLAPFVPPKVVKLKCLEYAMHRSAGKIPPKCGACWMPDKGLEGDIELTPEDRETLAILEKPDNRVEQSIREKADIPKECKIDIDIKSVHNVHQVGLVPDASGTRGVANAKHEYVLRSGYYFGPTVEANKVYDFTGYSTSHPDTQQVTHVFVKADSALSEVDRFAPTKERYLELDTLFKADGDSYEKLMDVWSDFARHVTKIVQRPLLHAAVDLVWHSPLSFHFNGERVPKGWMECLIFGDTRCGKGYVAEGLSRWYGLGEIVSGENCSVAGLVGGLETMGRRLFLRWGAVPLNDRGLVIIDEFGDMPQEILARLSRVRSEGVAEVTKVGHHQRTMARTRLIWLCNPREGVMADFTYGVLAVPDIVGKAEDVARFDYALAVAESDVSADAINRRPNGPSEPTYGSAECRDLVHWAWSRKENQIKFTDQATRDILDVHSKELAAKYTSSIPLIQGQTIRIKLAKLSAAVAARVFSHPKDDYETLVIRSEHAETAARLLDEFYKSPAMAYDAYSRKHGLEATLANRKELTDMVERVTPMYKRLAFVRGMLGKRITTRSVCSVTNTERDQADQEYINVMIRCNAIRERANGTFTITPSFKRWLEERERELEAAQEQVPE